MTVDLDALEKLADAFDCGAYSTSGAMARTYGPGGKIRAAQDIKALITELKEAQGLLKLLDDHLGEDDGMWSDESTVCTEWIGAGGIRHSLTFGMFRRIRAFLAKAQGGE
jgi:hypothetical protein